MTDLTNFSELKELSQEEIVRIFHERGEDEVDALENIVLLSQIKGDDPESFAYFYRLIFGLPIPPHAQKWVEAVYNARERGRGIVIEAFRGSTKTTTLTIGFTCWRIGWEPEKANLLIQVGDDIANDNSLAVASIIEHNPGFAACFPNLAPDKEMGWGAQGYEVKRTDMDYVKWRKINSKRKDPTLLGVGYKSHSIIGKHPDGLLIIDDINDELNTASERELAKVRRILTDTIFPTKMEDSWTIFVGTPWVENDVLHYVSATGEYDHVKTPVYRKERGKTIYVWPEKFPKKVVKRRKREVGFIGFARMYELDLEASKNQIFKYTLYPSTEIYPGWPMVGGVDYAGTMDAFKNKSGDLDYFAIAYVAKLPGGGAVVVDGVLDHTTQAQAETYVKRAQQIFPNWLNAVVEADVRGEDFIQVISRNPGLRIIPMKTGGKGKGIRLERQMGPWLENGFVRISDADTPYLNELRHELDLYPNCAHDDALDALYWALRGMPDVLTLGRESLQDEILEPGYTGQKQENPFIAFGSR